MDLSKLRHERSWSQEQLAEISGVSARTVQRIEKGEKAGMETLKALAAAFGISSSELQDATAQPKDTQKMSDKILDALPNKWKGFFLHLITFMVVTTWLFILGQFFFEEATGYVALFSFFWAMWLMIHALNLNTPEDEE